MLFNKMKSFILKFHDLGIFFICSICVICVVGYSARFILNKDDSPVEEMAECVLEKIIEDTFSLPSGYLDIDFSPDSYEDSE
jgi:hypothetical protein